MLSLMTVVLPSQQLRGRTVVNSVRNCSEDPAETASRELNIKNRNQPSINERSRSENTGLSLIPSATEREVCECSCKAGNMTKNNLPQRCPYLKGYMVEPRRQQHQHQHQMMHPVTLREWESLREAACYWKDKYDRLHESQRRLQKVNEGLEEKLLKVAEKFENEKADLTRDLSDLTTRLVEARLNIAELEEENEQYRNDCNIAVRLLQCKPSNFVAHKFNSLPADFQAQVKRHIHQKKTRQSLSANGSPGNFSAESSTSLLDQCPPDVKTIKVSVPTFPPAAMVYSVNNQKANNSNTKNGTSNAIVGASSSSSNQSTPDHVSAVIIAKVLEERSKERQNQASLKRKVRSDTIDTSTQTTFKANDEEPFEDISFNKSRSNINENTRCLSNYNNDPGKYGPNRIYLSSPPHTTASSTETAI